MSQVLPSYNSGRSRKQERRVQEVSRKDRSSRPAHQNTCRTLLITRKTRQCCRLLEAQDGRRRRGRRYKAEERI